MSGVRARTTKRRGIASLGNLAMITTGLATATGFAWVLQPWKPAHVALDDVPQVQVRRVDLTSTVSASGQIQCVQQTTIECEIENLQVRNDGKVYNAGGSAAIIEMVPDGTKVVKGQVLMRIDSSDYEELVHTQAIKVEKNRSEKIEAELSLSVAELALEEFEKGSKLQTLQQLEGEIRLADSEIERMNDRLEWSVRMQPKGYVSLSQVNSEKSALLRSTLQLSNSRGALANYKKFGQNRSLKQLQAEIEKGRVNVRFKTEGLTRVEERLAHYQKLVEKCTIRAPHDGLAIIAMENGRAIQLEPGSIVRQRQKLYYLPDLGKMMVKTLLHESVVDKVKVGMRTKVRVEALSDILIDGTVQSMLRVPLQSDGWSRSNDVKHYVALVNLDGSTPGLKPSMTAEVEVFTQDRPAVLAIPTEALAVEDGQDVCYVTTASGAVERRDVEVGEMTPDLLEVTRGLKEGEQIVLHPSQVESVPGLVVEPGPKLPKLEGSPVATNTR
jgi:HlyD family secretion protein